MLDRSGFGRAESGRGGIKSLSFCCPKRAPGNYPLLFPLEEDSVKCQIRFSASVLGPICACKTWVLSQKNTALFLHLSGFVGARKQRLCKRKFLVILRLHDIGMLRMCIPTDRVVPEKSDCIIRKA